MKKFFLMIVCAVALSVQGVKAQDEVITNQTIIQLLDEGFSDEEIIGLIEMSSTREVTFNIQTMRELKQHNASAELIKYIQSIAKKDFGYDGVYWWNVSDGEKPQKLYRSSFEIQEKKAGISGFSSAIAGGLIGNVLGGSSSAVTGIAIGAALGGGKVKSESLVLLGKHAAVVLTGAQASNPTFRFYFPKTDMDAFNGQADNWYYAWMNDIQSPNEFECVKLKEKKDKRTLPSGLKFSVAGFGSSSGGNKNVVDFEIKSINNTTFEVCFPNGLEPGEYCFFYKNIQNKWFAQNICCFDFSVQ